MLRPSRLSLPSRPLLFLSLFIFTTFPFLRISSILHLSFLLLLLFSSLLIFPTFPFLRHSSIHLSLPFLLSLLPSPLPLCAHISTLTFFSTSSILLSFAYVYLLFPFLRLSSIHLSLLIILFPFLRFLPIHLSLPILPSFTLILCLFPFTFIAYFSLPLPLLHSSFHPYIFLCSFFLRLSSSHFLLHKFPFLSPSFASPPFIPLLFLSPDIFLSFPSFSFLPFPFTSHLPLPPLPLLYFPY